MSTDSKRPIFRQAALDRLSSPEQLEQLVTIADSKGWVALAAIAVLLACLVLWSLFGSIPSNIKGQGILISQDGQLSDAIAPATGRLLEIKVDVGDSVEKAQVIAVIKQNEMEQKVESLREVVVEQEGNLLRLQEAYADEAEKKAENTRRRKAAIQKTIAAATERVKHLRNLVDIQQNSVARGTVTPQQVAQTQADLNTALLNISNFEYEILKLEADAIALENRHDQALAAAHQELNGANRRLVEMQLAHATNSEITAPTNGLVTEIKQSEGTIVQQGQSVVSMESFGERLQVLLYIPTKHGKKVMPGMAVRIEPVTVKKEEYGTLLGAVTSISNFPVTREGMATILRNDALIASFSMEGSPYAARVDLFPDETLHSGYRWTSRQGAPVRLSSGTTLKAEVTVREQRPISLVIPALKKATGIYLE